MKTTTRIRWALGLSLALMTPTAMADWSIEVGAGIITADTDDTRDDLEAKGYTINSYRSDDQASLGQIRIGYQLLPTWRVQIGYIDLGEFDSSVDANLVTTEAQLAQDFADAQVTGASGIVTQLTGDIRVSDRSAIRIGIGAFTWNSEQQVRANLVRRKIKRDGTSGTLELGYSYNITSNIDIGASWQLFHVNNNDIQGIQARVGYRFGE